MGVAGWTSSMAGLQIVNMGMAGGAADCVIGLNVGTVRADDRDRRSSWIGTCPVRRG